MQGLSPTVPLWGGVSQGGLGSRRSVRKRGPPAWLYVSSVMGITTWQRGASGRRKKAPAAQGGTVTSAFVGGYWHKLGGRWRATIQHDGAQHCLGLFDDEREAARAFDDEARRLRPTGKAHGGRAGTQQWHRLNFPTATEQVYAAQQGIPAVGSLKEKSAMKASAAAQGFRSAFNGVTWHKLRHRWEVSCRGTVGRNAT